MHIGQCHETQHRDVAALILHFYRGIHGKDQNPACTPADTCLAVDQWQN